MSEIRTIRQIIAKITCTIQRAGSGTGILVRIHQTTARMTQMRMRLMSKPSMIVPLWGWMLILGVGMAWGQKPAPNEMPVPLKCGKYQHLVVALPNDFCVDNLHTVTEKEWQETQKKIACMQEWIQRTVLHKFDESMNDCASELKPKKGTP